MLAVEFTDNSYLFLQELEKAKKKALKTIGLKSEAYAKKLCPVGTPESTGIQGYRGGTLRNSITHRVSENVMELGSNVEYAAYVELGTGPHFTPPPEWEQFTTKRGSGVGKAYVKPRPYIRPAIEDHRDEYQRIMQKELGG